jgi:hypothetical protein
MEAEYYEGYGCAYMHRMALFGKKYLQHCCTPLGCKAPPIACAFSGGPFPWESFAASHAALVTGVREGGGSCEGCLYLRKGKFPKTLTRLQRLNFHNFWGCNCKCSYCTVVAQYKNRSPVLYYDPLDAIKSLHEEGRLEDETMFYLVGSGETALYKPLKKMAHPVSSGMSAPERRVSR